MVSAIEKRENDLLILPWTAIKATTYAWPSIVGGSILLILLVTLPLGDVGLNIFLKFLAELREPALSVRMNVYATSFIILLLGLGWGRELAALLYPRVSACLHTPLQALLPTLTATYAIFQRTGLETLVLSQLGLGICLRKGPIELSWLVGSVDGGGGSDGQG